MMTRGRILLFVGAFAVALILFMPLSMALSMFGLTGQGLAARRVSGTVWSGQLVDARIGRLPVGDVDVGLRPLSLLLGRARIDMRSAFGTGSLTSTSSGFAVDDATAKLATARVFAPIPLDSLDLTNVSAAFVAGRCSKAEGRVRAMFAGDVGGVALAQGLSGVARCDGSALLLPLVSQSAMERLNLHIDGNGEYRAQFFVRSSDPAMAEKLGSAGFGPAPGGFVLRLAGKL
jgi:general secretion pathway protein N